MKTDLFPLTVDAAILSIVGNELGVLLVKREKDPDANMWSLPGGFIQKGESPEEAIKRVLSDKVGVSNIELKHLDWFSDKKRDPRGEITSLGFVGIVDYESTHTKVGKSVTELKWVPLSEVGDLALDHNKILEAAKNRVVSGIRWTDIGFHLMPQSFTIPDLKKVFEKVIDSTINLSNFRTKILKLGILNETGETLKTGGKGKPAPIYTLNLERLNNLPLTVTIFN